MTMLWDEKGVGVLMNSSYDTVRSKQLTFAHEINMHEFHFVDDGRRAIVLRGKMARADVEDARSVGIEDQVKCLADFDGFEEFDTTTWETTFKWSSFGHIRLSESTWSDSRTVRERCAEGWDFLHANSVDKSESGDFFVSARFTNAIYKVSKKDGSIMWRLGGIKSDFEMGGVEFSGQHSVRYVSENETHTLITILDNAKIDDQVPTHESSRGLLLALDTAAAPMTVSVVTEYPHPHGAGGYAKARGNLQTLENGNVFIGWSERATQSEHLANGTLVMDAQLVPTWLGSYRNYKFPFVGRPREAEIAVVSAAHTDGSETTTTVHVSWNGATEVKSWSLFDAFPETGRGRLRNTTLRTGFETQIQVDGFARHVVLEAIDAHDKVLGSSQVTFTEPPQGSQETEKTANEQQQQQDIESSSQLDNDDLLKNMPPPQSPKIIESEQSRQDSETVTGSHIAFGNATPYLAFAALMALILFLARTFVRRRKFLGRLGSVCNVRESILADDDEVEKAMTRARAGSVMRHRYKPSR